MRNLKLEIEYDGARYAGWQSQRIHRLKTIQETIEKTLQRILQERVRLIVSGRTDSGVHALAQIANFHTHSGLTIEKLKRALNGLLPDDIAIIGIEEVDKNFHSRFDAKSKVYRYTILNQSFPSPLLRKRVYFYPYPLDIKLMLQEARCLIGRHDFKSFQAADKMERNSIETIKKLKITKDKNLIYIDIEADGFLYNMVRNIAGTLVEIGRGRFVGGSLKKILLAKNRKLAGPTLPACGLCLMRVRY